MPLSSTSPSRTEGVPAPSGAASLQGRGHPAGPGSVSWGPPIRSSAAAQPAAVNDDRALFDALIQRAGFDPAGFDFAVHPIRESADLGGHMDLMVTVTCRAARISRTYLSRARDSAWLSDLSDDLRAGVYGT